MKTRTMTNGTTKLKIEGWANLRNGWEYYFIKDRDNTEDIKMALVMGFETEIGSVYLPELKPYIWGKTTNLQEVMPAIGWRWED